MLKKLIVVVLRIQGIYPSGLYKQNELQQNVRKGEWLLVEEGPAFSEPRTGHPWMHQPPMGPRGELASGTFSPSILANDTSPAGGVTGYPYLCIHSPGQCCPQQRFLTFCFPSLGCSKAYGFSTGFQRGPQRGDLTTKRLDSPLQNPYGIFTYSFHGIISYSDF